MFDPFFHLSHVSSCFHMFSYVSMFIHFQVVVCRVSLRHTSSTNKLSLSISRSPTSQLADARGNRTVPTGLHQTVTRRKAGKEPVESRTYLDMLNEFHPFLSGYHYHALILLRQKAEGFLSLRTEFDEALDGRIY